MITINKHIDNQLLVDIRQLVESAKASVAVAVNSAMTMMYWHIGDRINRELLGEVKEPRTASRL